MDIEGIFEVARLKRASDLHLRAGMPPIMRIDGDLEPLAMEALSNEVIDSIIGGMLSTQQLNLFEQGQEVDLSTCVGGGRCRVNVFRHSRGVGVVFRLIPQEFSSLQALEMPEVVSKILSRGKGLVLVTGPTGSGKSTTLAAMIDHLNKERAGHIVTVEDPIEFVHTSKRALITQREVGGHTVSFSAALRSALREDPDVIMVGELRDLETIQLALTAAETGHLVLATLHTASAAKTVDRIIDVFPAEQQAQVRAMFAESLEAVISQRLIKRVGGGRVAALEVLIGTTAVRHLIREGKSHQLYSVMQTSHQLGMQTMERHLAELSTRVGLALDLDSV